MNIKMVNCVPYIECEGCRGVINCNLQGNAYRGVMVYRMDGSNPWWMHDRCWDRQPGEFFKFADAALDWLGVSIRDMG